MGCAGVPCPSVDLGDVVDLLPDLVARSCVTQDFFGWLRPGIGTVLCCVSEEELESGELLMWVVWVVTLVCLQELLDNTMYLARA
jgi:hypothetical protein